MSATDAGTPECTELFRHQRRLAAAEARFAGYEQEADRLTSQQLAEKKRADAAESALRSAGERVREECAKLCGEIAAHHFDRYRNGTIGTGRGSQHAEGMADGAEACETAIRRALPVQGEAEPPLAGVDERVSDAALAACSNFPDGYDDGKRAMARELIALRPPAGAKIERRDDGN